MWLQLSRQRGGKNGEEEARHVQCVLVCVCKLLSCVRLFATPGTVASQAPLSMGLANSGWGVKSGLLYISVNKI